VAFLLAVLLWRANRGAEYNLRAKELLAEAEAEDNLSEMADDDPAPTVLNSRRLYLVLEHVYHMLVRYVWPFWRPAPFRVPPPAPRADDHHCASPYGRVEGWGDDAVEEGWCGKRIGYYRWQPWSNFCSEDCRIRFTCESFLN
jgi:hypothetical protein